MKWIPSKKKLPKLPGKYLVTIEYDGERFVDTSNFIRDMSVLGTLGEECFSNRKGVPGWYDVRYDFKKLEYYETENVTAWAELPEPYMEKKVGV